MKDEKALTKRQKQLISELEVLDKPEMVQNPYSGAKCLLEPVAVALYDYIKGCEITGKYERFDEARYLFAEQWPEQYMLLLD